MVIPPKQPWWLHNNNILRAGFTHLKMIQKLDEMLTRNSRVIVCKPNHSRQKIYNKTEILLHFLLFLKFSITNNVTTYLNKFPTAFHNTLLIWFLFPQKRLLLLESNSFGGAVKKKRSIILQKWFSPFYYYNRYKSQIIIHYKKNVHFSCLYSISSSPHCSYSKLLV